MGQQTGKVWKKDYKKDRRTGLYLQVFPEKKSHPETRAQ